MSKRARPPEQPPGNLTLEAALRAFRAQRSDEAEHLARQVLRAAPGDVIAAQLLGHLLLGQGRPDDAIAPLQAAVRQGDDAATETLLARALAAYGRRDEAFDQLRRTTARRPAFALAFVELGDQLGEAGRLDEAAATFEQGLALMPAAAALRVALGRLLLLRNGRAGARALFLQVHEAEPARHDALVGLGQVQALDGEYREAIDAYSRALRLRPDDAGTRISLAKCWLELGERAQGEAMLREVVRRAPAYAGLATTALAATPHGRLFLRPSQAVRFLGGGLA